MNKNMLSRILFWVFILIIILFGVFSITNIFGHTLVFDLLVIPLLILAFYFATRAGYNKVLDFSVYVRLIVYLCLGVFIPIVVLGLWSKYVDPDILLLIWILYMFVFFPLGIYKYLATTRCKKRSNNIEDGA